jgi:hypothetical protein
MRLTIEQAPPPFFRALVGIFPRKNRSSQLHGVIQKTELRKK